MNFYGQEDIIQELKIYMKNVKKGKNYTFLFIAGSGFGKTELAKIACSKVTRDFNKIYYVVPDDAGKIECSDRRIWIIDEVHTLKNPELLYPIIDQGKHTIFLLTNEAEDLKEPLINRCLIFRFNDYTLDEIITMIGEISANYNISLTYEMLKIIANESNLNPRVSKKMTERLCELFQVLGVPKSEYELKTIIEKYLGVKDGLTRDCRKYLDFLNGKIASLELISNAIQISKGIIKKEIEPVLIKKNLIEIGYRGRRVR